MIGEALSTSLREERLEVLGVLLPERLGMPGLLGVPGFIGLTGLVGLAGSSGLTGLICPLRSMGLTGLCGLPGLCPLLGGDLTGPFTGPIEMDSYQ